MKTSDFLFQTVKQSVPGAGVEPARPCGHKILSLAWLPITPPGQVETHYVFGAGTGFSITWTVQVVAADTAGNFFNSLGQILYADAYSI